ncbi:MAG: oligosaccharide repeat unit polymerase [Pseudomonadales bacterium]|nr:oligosaccharide repeat unit polymerase [Pseudomonadales bacterium]
MIEDVLFAAIWVLLPIFWHLLLRVADISLLRVTIPSFLLIGIYVFQYIGFPILFFGLDDYRASFVQDKSVMWMVFFYSSITITLLIVGFITAKRCFGPICDWHKFSPHSHTSENFLDLQRLIVLLLFIVSSLVLFRYVEIIGLGNIALLSVLEFVNSEFTSEQLRSEMGNAFSGNYHWYKLFMRDLMVVTLYSSFAMYLLKPRFGNLLLFAMIFVVTSFSMLAAIEKGPFMGQLIGLFLIYVFLRKSGYIRVKYVVMGVPVLFLVMGISFWLFTGAQDVIDGMQRTFSRMFTGQMQGLYHYLEIFPESISFLYGTTFPNPGGLLPYTPFRLTVEVMSIVTPQDAARGVVGSMPTFFWGEMYANFGFLGVIIPPFFVGFLLYWFNLFIMRLPMTPILVAFLVWVILHFIELSTTGLSTFIIDFYLLLLLTIVMTLLFISSRGIVRLKRIREH